MGNFVPKAPFDLTAFLSQKATPAQTRFRGRPAYKPRPSEAVTPEDQEDLGGLGEGPSRRDPGAAD